MEPLSRNICKINEENKKLLDQLIKSVSLSRSSPLNLDKQWSPVLKTLADWCFLGFFLVEWMIKDMNVCFAIGQNLKKESFTEDTERKGIWNIILRETAKMATDRAAV